MHPPINDNESEALLQVRGKAVRKQCGVLAINETVVNLPCFYKKLLPFYTYIYVKRLLVVVYQPQL